MTRNPDHAGALHLYVHAVEASADPQRGVVAADRLRTLIPGSGHLVHMPAHIYARVGRWHDAVRRQPDGDRRRRRLSRDVRRQRAGACIRSATCRTTTTSCGSPPAWRAPARSRGTPRARRPHRVNLPDLMRQPGYRGPAALLDDAVVRRVRFGRWDEIRGGTQSGARPALRHGDLDTTRRRWLRSGRTG